MLVYRYIQGADLPDLGIVWRDPARQLINFGSIAHTFQLRIGQRGKPATITKTTGITGADSTEAGEDTLANVTIAWAIAGELNTLTVGTYDADLIATRTSNTKDRKMRFRLIIEAGVQ